MKIILHYPKDFPKAAKPTITEWLQEQVDNKRGQSPLKYVEKIEVVEE
jgi:hypothetical protein